VLAHHHDARNTTFHNLRSVKTSRPKIHLKNLHDRHAGIADESISGMQFIQNFMKVYHWSGEDTQTVKRVAEQRIIFVRNLKKEQKVPLRLFLVARYMKWPSQDMQLTLAPFLNAGRTTWCNATSQLWFLIHLVLSLIILLKLFNILLLLLLNIFFLPTLGSFYSQVP